MVVQGHSTESEFEPGLDRRPFVESGVPKQENASTKIESRSWKQGVLSMKTKKTLFPNKDNKPLYIVIALTIIGIILFFGMAYLFFGVIHREKEPVFEQSSSKSHSATNTTPPNLKSSTTTTMKAALPVDAIVAAKSSSSLEAMRATRTTEVPTTTTTTTTTTTATTTEESTSTSEPTSTVTFPSSTTTTRKTTTTTIETTTTPEIETTQDEVHPMEYFGNNLDKNNAEDCLQHYANGGSSDIYPITRNGTNMKVFCEMEIENGGWTVIQRRVDDKYRFWNRKWAEYAKGFGDLKGTFWLGLDIIHALAPSSGDYVTLRIELLGSICEKNTCSNRQEGLWFGEWDFRIGGQETGYQLDISQSTKGNLTNRSHDVFYEMSNGQPFSTSDHDMDASNLTCSAFRMFGPWWHSDCSSVSLNGKYLPADGLPRYMMWTIEESKNAGLLGQSYIISPKQTTMMIRPKF